MSFKYGFELEAFYYNNETGLVTLPPFNIPTDGFPGLVEIRTTGGNYLEDAYFSLLQGVSKIGIENLRIMPFHTFSAEEKRSIRRVHTITKEALDVQNIYGKKPRSLGNKTIASLQINVSNQTAWARTDSNGTRYSDHFGLLDVAKIVKNLDKEFSTEIKSSGRQPGEYAIKGDRLEYRSLPNTVFEDDLVLIPKLLERIKKAVEEKA